MEKAKIETSTGAFSLLDGLVQQGVTSLFGYPGGAILPIYDELYWWEQYGLIKHYLVRHEQGAAHAADGYARCSGKVGVCFATSGPGATNLVTGIATAQLDSIPMIVITGQVGSTFIGTDAFQEIDTFGITLSIVKHSYVVRSPNYIQSIVAEAFYVAQNGRPGPVLIDIPKDIGLKQTANYWPIGRRQIKKILHNRFERKENKHNFLNALALIERSCQPLFYVGGGTVAANAHGELVQLAEIFNIPVTTTLMGKGCVDEKHPLALGMLGMHGTAYANFGVSNCDLLIAVGARFDDRVTGNLEKFACTAVVIHIDIDPAEIAKNRQPNLAIIGDLKSILRQMILLGQHSLANDYLSPKKAEEHKIQIEKKESWFQQILNWKELYPLKIPKADHSLSPQEVIFEIGKIAPNAFYTTDVGQHQMWAAQFLCCQPRKWLSSSGLGTMGYGLPASIGAQVGFPEKQVICISGDSSFQMNIQELGTIAQYRLPIKIIVINNHWQGMVRQWQQSFYDERYSHSNMEFGAPDLVTLGYAYGIESVRIESRDSLHLMLTKALNSKDSILVEVCVVEDENCYPMVSPGQSNDDMLGVKIEAEKHYIK